MSSANTTTSAHLPPPTDTSSSPGATTTDDVASKAMSMRKRYEGLTMVRTKAIKGKGAWYWAYLEPILVKHPDTNLPKAVKLKCSFCDAVFSASNPSRTASEHLKRGVCRSFIVVSKPHSLSPLPLSSFMASPLPVHVNSNNGNRKRSKNQTQIGDINNSLAIVESTQSPHLVLSGGKEDLGPLAMLEDSVKKLKSPKTAPGPALSKDQIDAAVELLADWFYDSCESVLFSSFDHPKFRAFLTQVGLPVVSRKEVLDARLDSKFIKAKTEADTRIAEAMFVQVASNGWKIRTCCGGGTGDGDNLVKFMVNLPNGTSVYQKSLIIGGSVSSKLAEDVLWETVMEICGSGVQRCVGIVVDKFKSNALRNLEIQNQWMVNVSCQLQGFLSLLEDFSKELPVLRSVTENCLKIANFVNNKPQIRSSLRKHKMMELESVGLFRVPSNKCDCKITIMPVIAMLEDLWSSARVLQMVVSDDSVKVSCEDDPVANKVVGIIQNEVFWNELEAVYSLVKIIKGMTQEIEAERPLIGECLHLWEELRSQMKNWCAKYSIPGGTIETIVEKRFKKNYHPAWSAAFILDPLYLVKDNSGKYLPPFKCLTEEQERDVEKLITRLVSREEAHIALMELMKWRSEGLDPLYAQAVQVKQRDPVTGKMRTANPQSSRLVWETCLSEYKSLGKVAVRLLFLHATSCGFKCNWSAMKWCCVQRHSPQSLERAQKLIFVAAHTKLEKSDFSKLDEKDAELFATSGYEDDMLNEVFADASLM